jgi:hypothetical protein
MDKRQAYKELFLSDILDRYTLPSSVAEYDDVAPSICPGMQ